MLATKNIGKFTPDESLLLWEKVSHAKIIKGYKLNAARVTDEEFLTFVTTHPSARPSWIKVVYTRCSQPPSLAREGFC